MFEQHHQNLKQIERAISLIELALRQSISTSTEPPKKPGLPDENNQVYIYTKILSHLISSWIEVRVLKIAYEPQAFNAQETHEIITQKSFRDKWNTALEIAICKAYRITRNDRIAEQLSFSARARYTALRKIIDDELLSSYQIRNRIAHGQWLYAFKDDFSGIATDIMPRLRQENIVSLQIKYKLFRSLAQTIHDLAVSPKTFERDFDNNYRIIEEQQNNAHNRDYDKYKQSMREKYKRGIEKRRLKLIKP